MKKEEQKKIFVLLDINRSSIKKDLCSEIKEVIQKRIITLNMKKKNIKKSK